MIEQLMNGETVPEWEGEWLAAEERTSCLYCFDTYLINGLLQCPDYMQDILGSEDAVKMRQERQRRFLDAYSGRTLIAVMSESVLRANVGGPEIMARQMAFLAEYAELKNVILHIVPMKSRICARLSTSFMIAALENGREIAYVDDAIRGSVVEDLEDVVTLRALFNEIRAESLRKSEFSRPGTKGRARVDAVTWRKASRSGANGTQCVEIAVIESRDDLNKS